MSRLTILSVLVFITASLISISGFSQDHEHKHHHPVNEVGIALGAFFLDQEDEVRMGMHLHYIRAVALNQKFGIGAGFETIFDEHQHYTVSLVFQYRIIGGWTVAYAPGILWVKEEGEFETQFAQHIETAYEFELGKFHIGPMAEVGFEKHGTHYMLGVHLGIGF